jgi:hypothetical protein
VKNLYRVVLILFMLTGLLLAASSTDTVDLAVTVVGNVFTMELQDANAFPLAGELDLGRLEAGQSDFPVQGVIVAGCKSNTGAQWSLQAEIVDHLIDKNNNNALPDGALKVRGLSPSKSPGGQTLPGNLVVVEQSLSGKPLMVYTSDNKGDLGFNNYEGTYIPLGFGVTVPHAQPAGTYSGRVLLTLTE